MNQNPLLAVRLLLLALVPLAAQDSPDNLLRNGGFEDDPKRFREPMNFTVVPPLNEAILEGGFIDDSRAHSGRRSFCLNLAQSYSNRTLTAQQTFRWRTNARLALSCWALKGDGDTSFTLTVFQRDRKRQNVASNELPVSLVRNKWSLMVTNFEFPRASESLTVEIVAKGLGKLWLDDLVLRVSPEGE